VDTEASYDVLINKARWGNLNKTGVYVDPESRRNSLMPKQNYLRLAKALQRKGKNAEAITVADKCIEVFPNDKITFDYYMLPLAEVYFDAGAAEKGTDFLKTLATVYIDNLNFYNAVNPKFASFYHEDSMQAYAVLARVWEYADEYGQRKLLDELKDKMIIPNDLKDIFK
jgi:tetratricopeptide (TPR) repeat protein